MTLSKPIQSLSAAFALALATTAAIPSAHALELGVLGGMGTPKYSDPAAVEQSTSVMGNASPYFGVLVGFGALESGVIYKQQKIKISTATSEDSGEYAFVDVPLMLRMSSGRTSLGFGAYYSKYLSYKFAGASVSGRKHDHYGATANLRFRLLAGLSIETRINLMLTDKDSGSGDGRNFHNMMTGLTLTF